MGGSIYGKRLTGTGIGGLEIPELRIQGLGSLAVLEKGVGIERVCGSRLNERAQNERSDQCREVKHGCQTGG